MCWSKFRPNGSNLKKYGLLSEVILTAPKHFNLDKDYLCNVLVVNPEHFVRALFFEGVIGGNLDGSSLDKMHLFATVISFQETSSDFRTCVIKSFLRQNLNVLREILSHFSALEWQRN